MTGESSPSKSRQRRSWLIHRLGISSSSYLLLSALLVNVIVGAAFVHYFFSAAFISGKSAVFLSPWLSDFQTYLTGANFFMQDTWHFPLFKTNMFERTTSQSLVFFDLVPLYAIFAKLYKSVFNYDVTYLAFWYVTVVFFQPVSFTLMLWSVGVRNFIVLLFGGVLAVLLPAFLFRVGHSALFGHFTFIISMTLYFFSIDVGTNTFRWPSHLRFMWIAWLCVVACISLYPLVFSLLFFSAALVQTIFEHRRFNLLGSSLQAFSLLSLAALVLTGTLYSLGYFIPYLGGGTIGLSSMNVLSTFIPQRSSLFADSVGFVDATGLQYEGFNYLGAGLLLLTGTALFLFGRSEVNFLRRHFVFVFLLLALILFAISNKGYAGHLLLWSIPAPDFLGNFRNTGRFIWPVTYFIIALALLTLDKLPPLRLALLLIVVVGFQWADTRLLTGDIWNLGHQLQLPVRVDNQQELSALIDKFPGVHSEPDYACIDNTVNQYTEDLAWYASRERRKINAVYTARFPLDWDCNVEPDKLLTAREKGYLTFAFYNLDRAPKDLDRSQCGVRASVLVCMSAKGTNFTPSQVESLFAPSDGLPGH